MKTIDHKETTATHAANAAIPSNVTHVSIDQQVTQAFQQTSGQPGSANGPGSSLPGTQHSPLVSSALTSHDPSTSSNNPDTDHSGSASASPDSALSGVNTGLASLEAKLADFDGTSDPTKGSDLHSDLVTGSNVSREALADLLSQSGIPAGTSTSISEGSTGTTGETSTPIGENTSKENGMFSADDSTPEWAKVGSGSEDGYKRRHVHRQHG